MKTPKNAYDVLKALDCLDESPTGSFRVVRAPKKLRELALFVAAIKTLGSWSVSTDANKARVELSTGFLPDEVLFKLRKETDR